MSVTTIGNFMEQMKICLRTSCTKKVKMWNNATYNPVDKNKMCLDNAYALCIYKKNKQKNFFGWPRVLGQCTGL